MDGLHIIHSASAQGEFLVSLLPFYGTDFHDDNSERN